ncbi:transposase domain-containing protein [Saccharothrix sp. NRRL B-16314]|uniref:transposase domain-containing protein n=1 Tax=Saccharothrix sp. NRRL B-16314 TaxID=1463825 RepID=UPI0009E03B4B
MKRVLRDNLSSPRSGEVLAPRTSPNDRIPTIQASALVDEVLDVTRRVQCRVRKLPSRVVVYFVLALPGSARLGNGAWTQIGTIRWPSPPSHRGLLVGMHTVATLLAYDEIIV